MDLLCYLCLVFIMFVSVHLSLVVACWVRADLVALVYDVKLCFATFLCGILGQVWNLIVSTLGLCLLSYFVNIH